MTSLCRCPVNRTTKKHQLQCLAVLLNERDERGNVTDRDIDVDDGAAGAAHVADDVLCAQQPQQQVVDAVAEVWHRRRRALRHLLVVVRLNSAYVNDGTMKT